jgi:hypothetical protein
MLEQLGWGLFIIGGVALFLKGAFIAFWGGVAFLAFVRGFFSALLKQGVKVTFRKITEKPIYVLVAFGILWFFGFGLWITIGLVGAFVNFLLD